MSLRAYSLTLSAAAQRLSNVYGKAPDVINAADDIPYSHLTLSASAADAFVGAPESGDAYAAQVLQDGAVAYWRLAEPSGTTAIDSSGRGHHGTYSGGVTLGQAGALANGNTAALFDAVDGTMSAPNHADLNPAAISVELWFNRTSAWPALQTMFLLKTTSGAWSDGYGIDTDGTTIHGWINNFNNKASVAIPAINVWRHLVMTYSVADAFVRLYLDGLQVGTFGLAAAIVHSATALQLSFGPGATAVAKLLDEVAIYPTVLSPSQIAAHYALKGATFGVKLKGDGAPMSLGPYWAGPTKLSNLYALGAGSTLRILGVPY